MSQHFLDFITESNPICSLQLPDFGESEDCQKFSLLTGPTLPIFLFWGDYYYEFSSGWYKIKMFHQKENKIKFKIKKRIFFFVI